MNYNSERLRDGLYIMCRGDLVGLVGTVGMYLISALNGGGLLTIFVRGILSLLCQLASLVGLVVSLVGHFKLCREHRDYKIAFILVVVGPLLSLLGICVPAGMRWSISIVLLVYSPIYMFLLVRATNYFLPQRERTDLVKQGGRSLVICVGCFVASNILNRLINRLGDRLEVLTVLMGVISLLTIVNTCVKLRYLRKSADALR